VTVVERLVPDVFWELFLQVVPERPVRAQGGGRRRHGDREVLAAIVYVVMTECVWRDLPPSFGVSGTTAHRRFTEWSQAEVWGQLQLLTLEDPHRQGDVMWSRCAIGALRTRAAVVS
jgi:transposase